jgi:hypothetical protein
MSRHYSMVSPLVCCGAGWAAGELRRHGEILPSHVKGRVPNRQQSQWTGCMTYQLRIAMLPLERKKKQKEEDSACRAVKVSCMNEGCRQSMCRFDRHPRGSRGPFSQALSSPVLAPQSATDPFPVQLPQPHDVPRLRARPSMHSEPAFPTQPDPARLRYTR